MYDSRSDYNQKQGAGGETKDGNQNANPTSVSNIVQVSAQQEGLGPNKIVEKNQVAQNENANAATTANAENTQTQVSNDEAIFNNAGVMGSYRLNIEYEGTKLKGSFALASNGAELSENYDAKLMLITTLGDIDICRFTINGKEGDSGLPNYGEFISEKDGWKEALIMAANPKNSSVCFKVYLEKVQKQFFGCKAIAKFDCPDYELKYGDITVLQDWEDILENPCCACYPDGVGTKDISLKNINGEIKKCPATGCQ
jgi:hypothetical protein